MKGKTKFFVALVVVLALAVAGCARAGGEVEVPINAEGASKVGSLEFVLVYDPALLEATKVEKGTLAGNAMMEPSVDIPGRVWVGMVDANGMSGDGSVAVVIFKVLAEEGTSPLTLEDIDAYNAETLLDIVTEATTGEFLVKDRSVTGPVITFTP